ncbi:MAG: AIPR family protein [Lachnospira sp.]|nr:AIPR family protein [Lachnospira sp.]
MSIQVERIQAKLEEMFENNINMSDVNTANISENYKNKLVSRQLAAYSLVMRCGIEAEIAANAITDGMKDCGIDAIYKDEDSKTLYLIQAKWSKDGRGTIRQGDTLKFVNGVNKIINFDFDDVNEKILSKKSEIESALLDMEFKIKMIVIYTSNQALPKESEDAILGLESHVNDEISELLTNETIFLNDIYEFMAHPASDQDILIDDVLINNWGIISDADGTHRGYYGMVNAGQIAEWWKQYGNSLLDKNIRFFKGDTEVNKGMIKTLMEEPEKFIYYNNGIKLISKKVTRKLAHSADRDTGLFHLEGVSIVNGAQTTGSIGECYIGNEDIINKAKVMVNIISLENSDEDFGNDITKLSNTQNRIENKAFVSMDLFQENLRRDLSMDGIDYFYKDGKYNTANSKACSIDDVTIAVGCYLSDISVTASIKRAYGSIFEDIKKTPYVSIFNSSLTAYLAWNCVCIYRKFEENNIRIQTNSEGARRLIAVHGNRFILHMIFQVLKEKYRDFSIKYFELTPEILVEIKELNEKLIDKIIIVKNELYPDAYPANLFKNAARCRVIKDKLETKSNNE